MSGLPTILVLDDERPQLLTVRATLGRIGRVKEFTDPFSALDFLKEHQVEAAIVDIHMPQFEMDGMEFIRNVRKFDPNLSIIVRTADVSADVADLSIEVRAFRRSIKHKTLPSQLQHLVVDAVAETRERRRVSNDAANTTEVKTQLAATLGSVEDEVAVTDGYRSLFQNILNQLTAIGGLAETLDQELSKSGIHPLDSHARKNKELVTGLINELNTFLDGPLAEKLRATGVGEHSTVNGALEALRKRFFAEPRWAAEGKQLKVYSLSQDLYVAASPLKLITALRHLVEFCLIRTASDTAVVLSASLVESSAANLARDCNGGLLLNLGKWNGLIPHVAISVRANLRNTSLEEIRQSVEEEPLALRAGNLQMIGLALGNERVSILVFPEANSVTKFEILVPLDRCA